MYVLHVCFARMFGMYVLHVCFAVCLACMFCMYVMHVCFAWMFYMELHSIKNYSSPSKRPSTYRVACPNHNGILLTFFWFSSSEKSLLYSLKQYVEKTIQNYTPTVMFRGTAYISEYIQGSVYLSSKTTWNP